MLSSVPDKHENVFSFMNVPDMILSIKSAVAKATAEEKARLGLCDLSGGKTEQSGPARAQTVPAGSKEETEVKSEFRPPFSQMKFKPTYDDNHNENSEKLTDDELVEMTLSAIEAGLQQKWQKLSDIQRRSRIQSFAEKLVQEMNISSENIIPLFELLRYKILIEKSLKLTDFQYDENLGNIVSISSLKWNSDQKEFVIVKSSPKKSSSTSQDTADSETANNSLITKDKAKESNQSSNAKSRAKDTEKKAVKKPPPGRKVLSQLLKAKVR